MTFSRHDVFLLEIAIPAHYISLMPHGGLLREIDLTCCLRGLSKSLEPEHGISPQNPLHGGW